MQDRLTSSLSNQQRLNHSVYFMIKKPRYPRRKIYIENEQVKRMSLQCHVHPCGTLFLSCSRILII